MATRARSSRLDAPAWLFVLAVLTACNSPGANGDDVGDVPDAGEDAGNDVGVDWTAEVPDVVCGLSAWSTEVPEQVVYEYDDHIDGEIELRRVETYDDAGLMVGWELYLLEFAEEPVESRTLVRDDTGALRSQETTWISEAHELRTWNAAGEPLTLTQTRHGVTTHELRWTYDGNTVLLDYDGDPAVEWLWEFEWDTENGRITGDLGQVFADLGSVPWLPDRPGDGTPDRLETWRYTDDGRHLSIDVDNDTDGEAEERWTVEYDPEVRMLSTTRDLGVETAFVIELSYDTDGRRLGRMVDLPSTAAPVDLHESWTYDERGNLLEYLRDGARTVFDLGSSEEPPDGRPDERHTHVYNDRDVAVRSEYHTFSGRSLRVVNREDDGFGNVVREHSDTPEFYGTESTYEYVCL